MMTGYPWRLRGRMCLLARHSKKAFCSHRGLSYNFIPGLNARSFCQTVPYTLLSDKFVKTTGVITHSLHNVVTLQGLREGHVGQWVELTTGQLGLILQIHESGVLVGLLTSQSNSQQLQEGITGKLTPLKSATAIYGTSNSFLKQVVQRIQNDNIFTIPKCNFIATENALQRRIIPTGLPAVQLLDPWVTGQKIGIWNANNQTCQFLFEHILHELNYQNQSQPTEKPWAAVIQSNVQLSSSTESLKLSLEENQKKNHDNVSNVTHICLDPNESSLSHYISPLIGLQEALNYVKQGKDTLFILHLDSHYTSHIQSLQQALKSCNAHNHTSRIPNGVLPMEASQIMDVVGSCAHVSNDASLSVVFIGEHVADAHGHRDKEVDATWKSLAHHSLHALDTYELGSNQILDIHRSSHWMTAPEQNALMKGVGSQLQQLCQVLKDRMQSRQQKKQLKLHIDYWEDEEDEAIELALNFLNRLDLRRCVTDTLILGRAAGLILQMTVDPKTLHLFQEWLLEAFQQRFPSLYTKIGIYANKPLSDLKWDEAGQPSSLTQLLDQMDTAILELHHSNQDASYSYS